MKNVFIVPAKSESHLYSDTFTFRIGDNILRAKPNENKHVYITNQDDLKNGDYCFNPKLNCFLKINELGLSQFNKNNLKKIILTTDPVLIDEGVQALTIEQLSNIISNNIQVINTKVKYITDNFVFYAIMDNIDLDYSFQITKKKSNMKEKITYDYLVENGLILFETIVGSQAYGTQTPTSDEDHKFVYILPEEFILGTGYVEQLNVTKDITGWEIRRFLELMGSNNPTVLELLNSPEDCIISKHPLFDDILAHKEDFITKICKDSFGGYARQQIKKAKGLNKKQNWEKDKVTRKDLLDFCYVIVDEKSIPWKKWNAGRYDEKFIGAVNVPNARDVYTLYYDGVAEKLHSEKYPAKEREQNKKILKEAGKPMGLGYKGLVNTGHEDEDGKVNYGISNQLRLSSIPKGEKPICNIVYNKDGYSEHCKDYKEYQEWLENRNEARYVETQEHGQRIDGKNMMHCMRLIRMATEIGEGKGIIVRRPDAQELLAIRRGEVDLDSLIDIADKAIENMDEVFENSNLPNSVDKDLVNKLLIKIRKGFYKPKKSIFNFWPFN